LDFPQILPENALESKKLHILASIKTVNNWGSPIHKKIQDKLCASIPVEHNKNHISQEALGRRQDLPERSHKSNDLVANQRFAPLRASLSAHPASAKVVAVSVNPFAMRYEQDSEAGLRK
jgi:hypothetical protein